MGSLESSKWKEAIKTELQALEDNHTWDLITTEPQQNIIDTKWVFKRKKNSEGKVQVYKARLVARGFQQTGISYDEVYSPVTSLTTVRILISIAAYYGWNIYQFDICSAFLHSSINEDIYIYLPEGHIQSGKVGKLRKAIYGLKKAPRYWYETFCNFMISQDFKRSKTDMCLYIKTFKNTKTFVIQYVDDILMISSDESTVESLKEQMAKTFKIKDLGLASYYVGIRILQNKDFISLDQCEYLKSILQLFNMSDCKGVTIPLEPNFNSSYLSRESSESQEIENRCRKLIGCIMYAMLDTRPDLSISISILSRFQN
ncbi:unnamed protein product [Euphydryas editha]|uniref:Reverse transcriptase Ty1/copia-type domain-containing protein n=1 Tax=Euphydryas editha TaxID=104508 RepID=A0AAU9TSV6_EUPED|nr:unnamed protein product [Euphydryas editha]